MLDILLVLNEAYVRQAKASQFRWGIKHSLLHLSADAQLRENSILQDDGDPLALFYCEGGKCKGEGDNGEYARCQC